MKLKTIIFSVALSVVVLAPNLASAFEVTDTKAYRLNDTTTLFTVTYEFGYLNAVALMPIYPTYGPSSETVLPHLTYELSTEGGEVLAQNEGTHLSVVLSGASLYNNHYQIEAGERKTFTLLVLHKAPEGSAVMPDTLSVLSFGHQVKVDGRDTKYMTVSDEQLTEYKATLSTN